MEYLLFTQSVSVMKTVELMTNSFRGLGVCWSKPNTNENFGW